MTAQSHARADAAAERVGFGVLWLLLGAALFGSLLIGRYPASLSEVLRALGTLLALPVERVSPQVEVVVLFIRLPRVLAAALIGSALSLSGAAFQGLFRNPIVAPDLLGATAGAGFGACLGLLLALGPVTTQLTAFAGGVAAVLLAYAASATLGRGTLSLLLSGIAVSALFSALISLTKLLADPANKLPAITFWLMGGLGQVTLRDVPWLAGASLLGTLPLLLLRFQLNVLALGEEQALTLGVDTAVVRPIVVGAATLLTAASVSVCGMVGWVGLLVPNIGRALVGARFDRLLLASALLGASFVLAMDGVSRSVSTGEIPLGVTLSLLGAPCLLLLLRRDAAVRS